MAEAWHIARRTRTCARSGVPIDPANPFYSALVERDDDFERLDYAAEAWPEVDKGAFFSYWRNKPAAEAGEKKPQVDFERILFFFDSLEGSSEPARRLFRYVLALALVRRRLLRLDSTSRTPEGDRLVVYDRRDGGRTVEILAPEATREQLDATQEKLNQLFANDDTEAFF